VIIDFLQDENALGFTAVSSAFHRVEQPSFVGSDEATDGDAFSTSRCR
jgi:hypothetical protein